MNRRGFFRSLWTAMLGGAALIAGGGSSAGCGFIPSARSDRHSSVSEVLFANGLAKHQWHYSGQETSGTVVSYWDPNQIDMLVQVNGEEIDRPVDEYQVHPGDEITVDYL